MATRIASKVAGITFDSHVSSNAFQTNMATTLSQTWIANATLDWHVCSRKHDAAAWKWTTCRIANKQTGRPHKTQRSRSLRLESKQFLRQAEPRAACKPRKRIWLPVNQKMWKSTALFTAFRRLVKTKRRQWKTFSSSLSLLENAQHWIAYIRVPSSRTRHLTRTTWKTEEYCKYILCSLGTDSGQ